MYRLPGGLALLDGKLVTPNKRAKSGFRSRECSASPEVSPRSNGKQRRERDEEEEQEEEERRQQAGLEGQDFVTLDQARMIAKRRRASLLEDPRYRARASTSMNTGSSVNGGAGSGTSVASAGSTQRGRFASLQNVPGGLVSRVWVQMQLRRESAPPMPEVGTGQRFLQEAGAVAQEYGRFYEYERAWASRALEYEFNRHRFEPMSESPKLAPTADGQVKVEAGGKTEEGREVEMQVHEETKEEDSMDVKLEPKSSNLNTASTSPATSSAMPTPQPQSGTSPTIPSLQSYLSSSSSLSELAQRASLPKEDQDAPSTETKAPLADGLCTTDEATGYAARRRSKDLCSILSNFESLLQARQQTCEGLEALARDALGAGVAGPIMPPPMPPLMMGFGPGTTSRQTSSGVAATATATVAIAVQPSASASAGTPLGTQIKEEEAETELQDGDEDGNEDGEEGTSVEDAQSGKIEVEEEADAERAEEVKEE